jgi:hypothetical protein
MVRMSRSFRSSFASRWLIWVIIPLSLLSFAGADGSVLSLSASGGSNYGENIQINVTVSADAKVNNSNFYFEIRAPDGLVVDTHSVDVPTLEDGDTYSYSWNSNNASYPTMGNYTVFFCWSPGNAHNCSIDEASSSFYSVPTFGLVLSIVALGLLGLCLWFVRRALSKSSGSDAG